MTDYSACSDSRLVSLSKAGTREAKDAFCELVGRYKALILHAALTVTPDIHAAEDIAQETFIDGYLQLTRLCDPEKFAPWMYGIAKRKALHYISRRRFNEDIDEYSELIPSLDASPEDILIRGETTEAVRGAVEKLSAKNREAAVLFYFENLPVSEVAKRLSIPEGTVKSRLFDARRLLKTMLNDTQREESGKLTENDEKLTSAFDDNIRERIDELTHYYDAGNKTREDFNELFTSAESMICSLDESEEKTSALEELYSALSNSRLMELLKNSDYPEWLRKLDGEYLPEMDKYGYGHGKGRLLFWRGCANVNLKNYKAAEADFTESERLCGKADIYHALAETGLRVYNRLERYADDIGTGFCVTAECYKIDGTKLRFMSQPGFSSGNEVLYSRHRMSYLNYFISRFNELFYDTSLEAGRVYRSEDGKSTFTTLSYDCSVDVKAGHFERCMRILYDEPGNYSADVYYANGVGMVRVSFDGVNSVEEYELSDYMIHGGEGYFPFAKGNRWNYVNPDLPDYLYQSFENEIDWTDGTYANFITVHVVSLKKNYMSGFKLDSDMYIAIAQKLCDEWKTDEATAALRSALRENSSQNSALTALSGIEYLARFSDYQKKYFRFCPSSYNASVIGETEGKLVYDEAGFASFGPYRFGTRGEENRIFGVKPFRYLQAILGRVWDDKWLPGYVESKTDDGSAIELNVTGGETIVTKAGTFDDCLKLTLTSERSGLGENYYFNKYMYTSDGKKEFWFRRGVGLVRFDCTWGSCLSSSAELVSFENPSGSESFLPVYIGSSWEYDETNLTAEGYRAKRLMKVLSGMNGKYFVSDCQEFLYLGTEEEYEGFKKRLQTEKSGEQS